MNNNYKIMKDHVTLYARDANEQVMAIYERDTIIHEFEDVEYSAYKTTLKISSVKNGCEYDLDLGGYSTSYSIDEDGNITILEDTEVECKNFNGSFTIPAGSKIYKNINNGLTTQGLSNFVAESYGGNAPKQVFKFNNC